MERAALDHLRKFIGRDIKVEIDRPVASAHPHFPNLIYPINYGFVPGTKAPDGSEIDVYILDKSVPLERCRATCVAVIERLDDEEGKLVAVLNGPCPPASEIATKTAFKERFFQTRLHLS